MKLLTEELLMQFKSKLLNLKEHSLFLKREIYFLIFIRTRAITKVMTAENKNGIDEPN